MRRILIAGCGYLGQAAADVVGSSCDAALPHTFGEWTGCPYCAMGGDEEFTEGADPCFGGYSVVSTSSYTEQGSPQKGTIHVVRDITDRRSAEDKYRLLFEQVPANSSIATMLSCTCSAITSGKNCWF